MIDLAVAVVIGGAFSTVITSLVNDVIMPSITYVTNAAAEASSKAAEVAKSTASAVGVTSKPADTQPGDEAAQKAAAAAATAQKEADDKVAADKAAAAPPAPKKDDPKAPVEITWTIGRIKIGNFIGSLINFVLIAAAVFVVIVKLLGSVMKRVTPSTPAEGPTTKECPYCLSVIPIKATKCAHCTADLVAAKPA
jgi:large conductance mechanosensitive channel